MSEDLDASALKTLFESLWTTYHQPIFQFLYHHVRDHDRAQIAEDLTQDTFASVYSGLAAMEGKDNEYQLHTWLYTIASNKLRDRARRLTLLAWSSLEGIDEDEAHAATDPQESVPELVGLYDALTHLDPRQQMALLLYYRDGYSHEEVAEQLGLKVGGVKMFLSRALQVLRAQYQVSSLRED